MEGTPFGHYQLLGLVGSGGMGQVFHAFDTVTDRVVALKVLPTHLAEITRFGSVSFARHGWLPP
jgi:hypothetical protein